MTTPTQLPPSTSTSAAQPRLRLRLKETMGDGAVDGSWWPRSRDLPHELADLVDHFPAGLGRVRRVVFSRSDWDTAPHRVRVAHGEIKTGSYPRADTHQVWLTMSTNVMIRLAVTTGGAPAPTLPAAATGASDEELGADSTWSDDGGSWWGSHPLPPSERS